VPQGRPLGQHQDQGRGAHGPLLLHVEARLELLDNSRDDDGRPGRPCGQPGRDATPLETGSLSSLGRLSPAGPDSTLGHHPFLRDPRRCDSASPSNSARASRASPAPDGSRGGTIPPDAGQPAQVATDVQKPTHARPAQDALSTGLPIKRGRLERCGEKHGVQHACREYHALSTVGAQQSHAIYTATGTAARPPGAPGRSWRSHSSSGPRSA
jgi:hypothetical protein